MKGHVCLNDVFERDVVCPKCGYGWVCRGRLLFIQCPNCRRFFARDELGEKKVRGDFDGSGGKVG